MGMSNENGLIIVVEEQEKISSSNCVKSYYEKLIYQQAIECRHFFNGFVRADEAIKPFTFNFDLVRFLPCIFFMF